MTTDDHEHASDEIGSAPTPESEVPDADEALDADVAMAVDADGDEPSVPEEPDYQDLYLRAAAETENVRKRARRDVEVANARGVAKLARELLPAASVLVTASWVRSPLGSTDQLAPTATQRAASSCGGVA